MMTLEQTLRAYRGYAPTYDLVFGPVLHDGRRMAVRAANSRPNQCLLEVGDGTGLSLPYFRPDATVTGIDVSPEMLAKAQRRADALPHAADWHMAIMDAQAMEFPDNSFDAVLALYVASTVQDPARFGAELLRVCRPGGSIVLVNHFSSQAGPIGLIEKWLGRYAARLGFEPDFPLDQFIAQSGLDPIEILPAGLFGYWTLLRATKPA
jgi:phosphatidylethanolamine/phosphatidyl-N-methylethanolamine N-methyltransferase